MFGSVSIPDPLRIHTLYTAFASRFARDYTFVGERHNFWELVIVLEGELGVTAGGKVLTLSAGQAILHPPMEFHRLWSEGNRSPHAVIVSFGATGLHPGENRVYSFSDLQLPLALLTQIRQYFFIDDGLNVTGIREGCVLQAQKAVKQLELFLLELLSQTPMHSPSLSRSAQNYARIVAVLEDNLHKSVCVAQIAALCNMSPVHLKQTFSRYAGIGVMNYFNRMKISAAIQMLQQGMTVQETAACLGFSNQNYFSTVFKRITGAPPSRYRQS